MAKRKQEADDPVPLNPLEVSPSDLMALFGSSSSAEDCLSGSAYLSGGTTEMQGPSDDKDPSETHAELDAIADLLRENDPKRPCPSSASSISEHQVDDVTPLITSLPAAYARSTPFTDQVLHSRLWKQSRASAQSAVTSWMRSPSSGQNSTGDSLMKLHIVFRDRWVMRAAQRVPSAPGAPFDWA